MPDMERLMRSLEVHVAESTGGDVSFVRGKHYGEDKARKQVAWLVFILVVLGVLLAPYVMNLGGLTWR